MAVGGQKSHSESDWDCDIHEHWSCCPCSRRSHWMKAQWRRWSSHLKSDHTKTRSWGSSFPTIRRSKAPLCWHPFSMVACFHIFEFVVCFVAFLWLDQDPRVAHMFGKSLEGHTGLESVMLRAMVYYGGSPQRYWLGEMCIYSLEISVSRLPVSLHWERADRQRCIFQQWTALVCLYPGRLTWGLGRSAFSDSQNHHNSRL